MIAAGRLRLPSALLALALSTGCWSEQSTQSGPAEPAPLAVSGGEPVRSRATAVLAAIRDRDPSAVAAFVHPSKGVRLSPYAYVDASEDQVLSPVELVDSWNGGAPRRWGVEDATGEPLEMSCAGYFERFVYDADFMNAGQVSLDRTIGRGNTVNNANQFYPDASIVEYHFPGFEPVYDGMDWRSLRLVFEEVDGTWYLVGIIHDQWTV